jgi:hypothetical protein
MRPHQRMSSERCVLAAAAEGPPARAATTDAPRSRAAAVLSVERGGGAAARAARAAPAVRGARSTRARRRRAARARAAAAMCCGGASQLAAQRGAAAAGCGGARWRATLPGGTVALRRSHAAHCAEPDARQRSGRGDAAACGAAVRWGTHVAFRIHVGAALAQRGADGHIAVLCGFVQRRLVDLRAPRSARRRRGRVSAPATHGDGHRYRRGHQCAPQPPVAGCRRLSVHARTSRSNAPPRRRTRDCAVL